MDFYKTNIPVYPTTSKYRTFRENQNPSHGQKRNKKQTKKKTITLLTFKGYRFANCI